MAPKVYKSAFSNGCSLTSVEFSPDSSLIAAGSAESTVRLWSLRDEKLKAKQIGERQLTLYLWLTPTRPVNRANCRG